MGFFQDLKEDLSQAVTELVPEEDTVISAFGIVLASLFHSSTTSVVVFTLSFFK